MKNQIEKKIYLLGFKNGHNGCGTDYAMIFRCRTGNPAYLEKRLREAVASFKKLHRHDVVYAVTQYTQKMCEMGPTEFTEYVSKTARKMA